MEDGRIVEQGDHAELLAAGGAYTRLYEAQFAAPADATVLVDPEDVAGPGAEPASGGMQPVPEGAAS